LAEVKYEIGADVFGVPIVERVITEGNDELDRTFDTVANAVKIGGKDFKKTYFDALDKYLKDTVKSMKSATASQEDLQAASRRLLQAASVIADFASNSDNFVDSSTDTPT
jgi:hypothetical protein